MPDLLSVIIPAYNAAAYLADAVASIHAQGYESVESIVVDDGSTDATAQAAQRLPGIRYYRQDNRGPAAARNTGIAAAQGTLLAFLDADDLWAKGKLAAQLEVLQNHPEIHLVAGRVQEFTSDLPSRDLAPAPRDHGQRAYTVGALLMRRQDFLKVGLFDPQLRFGEFMDWLSRAKALGWREHVLDQVVLHRRIHATNTTRLAQDHQRLYLAAIRRHLERQRAAPADLGGDGK